MYFPAWGEVAATPPDAQRSSASRGFFRKRRGFYLRPQFKGRVLRHGAGRSAMSAASAQWELADRAGHRNGGLGTICSFTPCKASARRGINRVFPRSDRADEGAIRLYGRLGFVTVKTVYKAVEHISHE